MERADEDATWVNERLAHLQASDTYEPNSHDAIRRLRDRQPAFHPRRFAVIGLTIACVVGLAITEPLWKRLLLSHAIGAPPVSAAVRKLRDGQAAPDFRSEDAAGTELRLSAYKGKVVALNFWATWCGGCKVEIPWLIEFEQRYGNRGFAVIGVSMDDEGWKAVKPYIASANISYPVILGTDTLAAKYGLDAMPMTFLIDRKGRVAATRVGLMDKDSFEREIRKLVAMR